MKKLSIFAVFVLLGVSIAAAAQEESLEALKARAEKASGSDQVRLYMDVAMRQLNATDQFYTAGDVEKAKAAMSEIVTYTEKASDVAGRSGKRLKETEIQVRKISKKLTDIKRTLNLEDRPDVQAAVDKLEQVRTALLSRMFGAGKG